MEILKILTTFFAITIFRYLTWIQLLILGIIMNTVHYFYSNKNNIRKYITELNSDLSFKNSLIILTYGIPLILINIGLKIIDILSLIWSKFIKTQVGGSIMNYLKIADRHIINKKMSLKIICLN